MQGFILVLNSGSSSIKFSVFETGTDGLAEICAGQAEGLLGSPRYSIRRADGSEEQGAVETLPEGTAHDGAIAWITTWLRHNFAGSDLLAVGHRVVHGGNPPPGPTRVDAALLARLEQLIPQMPLHLPPNVAPMRSLLRLRPQLPQVACFDTWFHRTLPLHEQAFALPRDLMAEGVRRYGFHGLSYEYVTRRLGKVAPALAAGRVIIAHLGSGASMCAALGGRSVATTMGFSGLDGLPMSTRCGRIDPGILLYLMDAKGMDRTALEDLLYKRSGMLGLSGGISGDMRALLASKRAEAGDAVNFFVHRACREIGSLAAALEGVDALVFTAGIGEHSPAIRAAICDRLGWLGVTLDPAANDGNLGRISAPESRVAVMVIPTDENRVVADHTLSLVKTDQEASA